MADSNDVLKVSHFGSRIAEEEVDELHSYFVETEQWRKLFNGEVDIVLGSKGSGKSALYSLLLRTREHLRLGKRTVFIAAENPRGTPVFRDLTTEPPLGEEAFRGLWKLYFLSIAANYVRRHIEATSTRNDKANRVIDYLTTNDLLTPNVSLMSRLKSALSYIRRSMPALEGSVTDPASGLELKGKITLGEPTPEERRSGYQSLDDLLSHLNEAFSDMNITVWLALDRLDVAFTESGELEENAIRSLFRAYLDMLSLSHIKLKIFLRDDIWKRVSSGGFREASHITRLINVSWDTRSLLNVVVRRLLANEALQNYYGVNRDEVLRSASLQENFFYRVFPLKVDVGATKSRTFDWMLTRTADGTKRTAPRELIHLLLAVRDEQLRLNELGHPMPGGQLLFSNSAIRAALPIVSKARYEQTLCAEYPSFRKYFDKLEREKTQHSRRTLAILWQTTEEDAAGIAEKCVEIGFFERRAASGITKYWVPFLYRDALNMSQGSAE
jgi:hypothetical protein